MTDRATMLLGGGLGVLWAILVVWVGATLISPPVLTQVPVLAISFASPGLTFAVMVFVVAIRRFANPNVVPEDHVQLESAADIDLRVLQNTMEQIVLSLCLWPAIAFIAPGVGLGIVVALSVAFPFARVAYWVGCRATPLLRMFGFSATFCPNLIALFWVMAFWAS